MLDPNLPVFSARLALRRLCRQDASAFAAYRADPVVARFQSWEAMSETAVHSFLAHMETTDLLVPGEWSQLGIAARDGNALLGDIGVHLSEDEARIELGITLSQAAQGQSLGFEAVELVCGWLWQATQAARIEAITLADNTRALALLERSPFAFVKTTHEDDQGNKVTEHWYELRRS